MREPEVPLADCAICGHREFWHDADPLSCARLYCSCPGFRAPVDTSVNKHPIQNANPRKGNDA